MIPYKIYKGVEGKRIYLKNDQEAEEICLFLKADRWIRDTIILVDLSKDIKHRVEIEIGENDVNILGKLKIVDVKTWKC